MSRFCPSRRRRASSFKFGVFSNGDGHQRRRVGVDASRRPPRRRLCVWVGVVTIYTLCGRRRLRARASCMLRLPWDNSHRCSSFFCVRLCGSVRKYFGHSCCAPSVSYQSISHSSFPFSLDGVAVEHILITQDLFSCCVGGLTSRSPRPFQDALCGCMCMQ